MVEMEQPRAIAESSKVKSKMADELPLSAGAEAPFCREAGAGESPSAVSTNSRNYESKRSLSGRGLQITPGPVSDPLFPGES